MVEMKKVKSWAGVKRDPRVSAAFIENGMYVVHMKPGYADDHGSGTAIRETKAEIFEFVNNRVSEVHT
jgi:hypothetical protein